MEDFNVNALTIWNLEPRNFPGALSLGLLQRKECQKLILAGTQELKEPSILKFGKK